MEIQIGMSETHRQDVAEGLSRLLADSYSLYLKSHNFHWNVTGPQFQALHTMFEEHYTELATAIDEIAERIRALGVYAPASYSNFSKLTVIEEENGVPSANDMVAQLTRDHELVAKTARSIFESAEKAADEVSADLLTQRLQVHEKTAWMLRSMLG